MTADEFPRRHPLVSFRPMGDEGGLVVLPTRQKVKVLNATGIKVFSMLDGTHSPAQIARAVAEEFDVTLQRAERDVRVFLDDLGRNGMLAGKVGRAGEAAHPEDAENAEDAEDAEDNEASDSPAAAGEAN